jgi:serine/threonine protein kinase
MHKTIQSFLDQEKDEKTSSSSNSQNPKISFGKEDTIANNNCNIPSNSRRSKTMENPNPNMVYLTNPKKNNKYHIIGLIGRGFYSKVYLSELISQVEGNKISSKKNSSKTQAKRHFFAVKILKKRKLIKSKSLNFILNENKILNHLNTKSNDFIINLLETFQDEERLYLIFPYYKLDLFHLLKNSNLKNNYECLKFLLAQVYLILSFLHSEGILYRDLKPENFVLDTETGYIRIIDFGLSKDKITEDSEVQELLGTNEYIPPEVILKEKYNFNFDWWGYGILMYEFFFGFPPFRGSNQKEIFNKILNSEINFYEGDGYIIPDDAKDLISYLLSKEKDCRIKPEQIIYHPFFRGIDFEMMKNGKLESPLKIFVKNLKIENNMENYNTCEKVIDKNNKVYIFKEPECKEENSNRDHKRKQSDNEIIFIDQSLFLDF